MLNAIQFTNNSGRTAWNMPDLDGVLRMALPKSEQAKPRSIQIGSGKSNLFSKLIGTNMRGEKKEDKVETH